MTSDEYRAVIADLGLSQIQAGKLLGVGPRTSRRWALDEARIPRAVTIVLRLMVKYNLTADDIEALKG